MNSGEMNCRIKFFEKVYEKGEWGNNVMTEKIVLECWAISTDQTLRERQANVGTVIEDTNVFKIRERLTEKVNTNQQIKLKNNVYQIVKIKPSKTHRNYTDIFVTEVV